MLLKRSVTEIAFSKGRATGVIAKQREGRYISAQARCIVCASDLTALVNRLCPDGTFPVGYAKSVNQRIPGIRPSSCSPGSISIFEIAASPGARS